MSEDRGKNLTRELIDDHAALNIIAERLRTKGSGTLRDVELRLRQQHDERPTKP
jgi:hypothetical protein